MKVLFTASVVSHIQAFHLPYLQYFRAQGFEVHTAAKGDAPPFAHRHYDIAFARSPFKIANIAGCRQLRRIINENGYDMIHCHTPAVGALTRLAARKARKKGTQVVYTAHGFHFYKGAPLVQAALFRIVEKYLSRYTDCLITMNAEDFEAVRKYGFHAGAYVQVHGVGVDGTRFAPQTPEGKAAARQACGLPKDAFVLIFAAEFIPRKNQQMLLKAAALLKDSIPQLLLLLPGDGPLRETYENTIEAYGLQNHVKLPGYRSDMEQLLAASDLAVSSSLQEGLPINIVEAMAVSLPVVATRVRGHTDLIEEGRNGLLAEVNDAAGMAKMIQYLFEHPHTMAQMQRMTLTMVQPFLLEKAGAEMFEIYEKLGIKKNAGE
jgi:glycosyltransferase EpsD